jgi:redox-sensitive bicupin YhaK (pirin superfamily)
MMIELVIDSRTASIGEGLHVRRILPFRERRMVGPFIFMDHAGPLSVAPEQIRKIDVLPYPHIGLSTVSYLFGGKVTHRDSLGVEQTILPGEVNWMTAGSGISHSERFEDPAALAGALEMIQTWVALPEKDEESDPSFTNYSPEQLPVFTEPGVWMRLIAGEAYGLKNSVKTNSPLFYVHLVLDQGKRFDLPKGYAERGVYVVKGKLIIGNTTYVPGQLVVFKKNADSVLVAMEQTVIMILGGEPLGDRYIWWNFVSSRKERIEQAKADWKEGRIKLPPNDNAEFVPLPEDKSRPAGGPAPEVLS